jgi:hypothetical protein
MSITCCHHNNINIPNTSRSSPYRRNILFTLSHSHTLTLLHSTKMPSSPTLSFPLYLLPSIPFRRRRTSSATTSSSQTTTPSSSPLPQPPSYLTSSKLSCQKCLADLLPTSSIISKGFTGRHGRAYLVSPPPSSSLLPPSTSNSNSTEWTQGDIPNTLTHAPVPRHLVTGAHTVSDISCRLCGTVLGWKYVEAEEEAQRYKVGKYILETRRIVKRVAWDEAGGNVTEQCEEDSLIEFDSQDEDECEDLFSGIWTGELARRRRKMTGFGRGG